MPSTVTGRPVVLIADYDGSDRRQMTHDFVVRGFDVEVSDDLDAATAAARRRLPHLVVFELRLHAGSGLDLLVRLRPELPAARFVVLTHYGSVASAVRAMQLGATNYLCKPATITEILRAAVQAPANDIADAGEDAASGVSPVPTLTLDEAIWEYINRTVEDAGSLSEAARRLGIFRQSLKRMISKYRPPSARLTATATTR
jgi:two-component system response regulator RegA